MLVYQRVVFHGYDYNQPTGVPFNQQINHGIAGLASTGTWGSHSSHLEPGPQAPAGR